MARRLKLTRSEVRHVNYQHLGAFRLRIDATVPAGSDADPHVFVYNRRPVNQYDATAELDDFQSVASPVDMAEYPVGGPDGNTTYPFFRTSYIELDLRSTAYVDEIWTTVVAEVDTLLRALDRLARLEAVQEVEVGPPADSGGSESGSTSGSTSGSAGP